MTGEGYSLQVTLLSDTTFGRGDGVPGLVDTEVEYEASTGLPLIPGRTLKGLLVEECAALLFALGADHPRRNALDTEAGRLFGRPGSEASDGAAMHVADATVPVELREAVLTEIDAQRLTSTAVLESLTAIRRQSAIDDQTGAPVQGALRSVRVVLRDTVLKAPLYFSDADEPNEEAQALLGACALCVRRGGMSRNRGRGHLRVRLLLDGTDVTADVFRRFAALVA